VAGQSVENTRCSRMARPAEKYGRALTNLNFWGPRIKLSLVHRFLRSIGEHFFPRSIRDVASLGIGECGTLPKGRGVPLFPVPNAPGKHSPMGCPDESPMDFSEWVEAIELMMVRWRSGSVGQASITACSCASTLGRILRKCAGKCATRIWQNP
jgi:hypothetical protein